MGRIAAASERPALSVADGLRLFATADSVGGIWTYALDLAREFGPRGVRTTLAVLGPAPDVSQRNEAAAVEGLSLIETGLPPEWLANTPDAVLAAGRALASLARETRAEIVQLNGSALVVGARFPAPVLGVCHSCVATWWAAVCDGALPDDLAWRAELTGRGIAAANALVAPSAAFADATALAYDVRPSVVRNGRRAVLATQPASGAPVRFALTAGRLWDEGKNMATLDRAAAALDLPLLAAGQLSGPNGAVIALRHARALGQLAPNVLAGWLAHRPVFASAALYEPFGLSVLEAAQAGCPLVLSDIPSFRELWEGAALFVPARDAAAIAAAILRADGPERGRLGEAARVRSRRYSAAAMAEGMLAAYRALLPRREIAA